ncbi:MAG: autotransporter outer membrane beta-barrel domain-containing protein [Sneathiella sp.]|nr:autotransporter outer membrane beta-barrel domain-containing protein [Sneathiella sp.]
MSIVALTSMLAVSGYALAAPSEITGGVDIVSSDAAGLTETNETGSVNIDIIAPAGGLEFGARGTPSIVVDNGSDPVDLTINIDAGSRSVTLRDDVYATPANNSLTLNIVNGEVNFLGDVGNAGAGSVDIEIGAGGGSTASMLVDAIYGSVVIDAAVDAAAVGDNTKLRLFNLSKNTANTLTFKQAIGGVEDLDNIEINSNVKATFEGTVDASAISVGTTSEITFKGNVTGDINFTADGTVILADGAQLTGDITTATDGSGALDVATTSSLNPVTGSVGASGKALKAITIDIEGQSVAFDGAVFAKTINIAGTDLTGQLSFNDGVTGVLALSDDVTIVVATDKVLDGSVTTGNDGEGTVTLSVNAADVTVATGQIGTDAKKIKLLDVTAADGRTAKLSGDVYADAVDVTGNSTGTVEFDGDIKTTGDITVNGGSAQFDGAVTSAQLIDATSGDAVFNNNVTATTGIVATGNSLTFSGASAQTIDAAVADAASLILSNESGVSFVKAVDDITTLDVAADAIATFQEAVGSGGAVANLNIAVGAIAKFEKTLAATNIDLDGEIRVEDAVTVSSLNVDAGSTITLGNGLVAGETAFAVTTLTTALGATVNLPATFTTGEITLFDAGVDISANQSDLTLTDNALVDYEFKVGGPNDDIIVEATAKTTAQTAADLGVSTDVATALPIAVTAADTSDAEGATALNAALNAGGATAKSAAVQVGVQADALAGATNANVGTSQRVFGVTSERLASLRFGGQYGQTVYEGLSTGDYDDKGVGIWIRPFGNWVTQDGTGGSAGYDATTYGIAGGADVIIDDRGQYRAGLSFAGSQTDVDGDGAGKATVEIQSFQLTAYTDFTGKAYFADLMAGYAFNGNDTSRVINFGGLDRTVTGTYDTHQFMVAGNAGIPFHLRGTAYLTPIVGFNYIHVMGEEYTEKGGGGFSQTVDQDSINVLIAKFDTRLHSKIRMDDAYLVPSLTGGVFYDVIGDEASATASYTGGGAAFTVEGTEVEQFGGHIGFGIGYEMDGFRIGFDYDAELKSGSLGHSARFEARVDF